MRAIVFRARKLATNDWVFGVPIEIGQKHYLLDLFEEKITISQIDIDTLVQYSGLRDAEENPIFEGDILRLTTESDNKLYVVKFWRGMFYASVEDCNDGIFGGYPLHFFVDGLTENPSSEVVGNIFDNADLVINKPTATEKLTSLYEPTNFPPTKKPKACKWTAYLTWLYRGIIPHDGDILYVIAREISIIIYSARSDDKILRAYVDYIPQGKSKGLYFNDSFGVVTHKDIEKIRYATEKEKKMLFEALAEQGLGWDAEKKEVIDQPQQ